MLKLVDGKWQFENEAALEKFLFQNLEECLGYCPVAQQLRIAGEICDIVAADADGTIVILELKNTEDRYVVQQLTRYYDNLINEAPNLPGVDLLRQPKLIAIAPVFHRHNFIDQKYSTLQFQLLCFSVVPENEKFLFQLTDANASEAVGKRLKLPSINLENKSEIQIDQYGETWRKALQRKDRRLVEWILNLREQCFSLHPAMGSKVTKLGITFGQSRGRNKIYPGDWRSCIKVQGLGQPDRVKLFAYLPRSDKILKMEMLYSTLDGTVECLRLPKRFRKGASSPLRGVPEDGIIQVEEYLKSYFRWYASERNLEQDVPLAISVSEFLQLAQRDWLKRLKNWASFEKATFDQQSRYHST
ncbi:MAG: endonuclease NucS domain-containing protein [Cyanophyceae cyanobacterium]